jgi:hypothetical protein
MQLNIIQICLFRNHWPLNNRLTLPSPKLIGMVLRVMFSAFLLTIYGFSRLAPVGIYPFSPFKYSHYPILKPRLLYYNPHIKKRFSVPSCLCVHKNPLILFIITKIVLNLAWQYRNHLINTNYGKPRSLKLESFIGHFDFYSKNALFNTYT